VSKKTEILLVSLLILSGFFIRIWVAKNTLFWQDEGESAIDTINLFKYGGPRGTYRGLPINYGAVGEVINGDFFKYAHTNPDKNTTHGWLTFVLAGTMLGFEKSTLMMRLPFCILTIFSAVLLYIITRRVARNKSAALFSILLYCSNFYLTKLEMQLRYYSLTVFIFLFSLYLFTNKQNAWTKIRTILVIVASYHIHFPTFLGIVWVFIYYQIVDKNKINGFFITTLVIILTQSYLFNSYTGWEIQRHLPILNEVELIYTKILYILLGLFLFAIYTIKNIINNLLERINLNRLIVAFCACLIGIIVVRMAFWMKLISAAVLISFLYFENNDKKKYLVAYSIISLAIIAYLIKPLYRNILPCIPLMFLIYGYLAWFAIKKIKYGQIFIKILMWSAIGVICALCFGKGYQTKSIDNNGYLQEIVDEMNKGRYARSTILVEYNHFPLLFYTKLKRLFYIWNINPEYLKNRNNHYVIILQPDINRKVCHYYYKRHPDMMKECDKDVRFFLRYINLQKCQITQLDSGAKIIECNQQLTKE
jgi:hypothetical protein